MDIEDPYLELGLAPGCTDAQVKAAWRRLAAQWHPDRNTSPQATRRIQRINRAVEAIRAQRLQEASGVVEEPAPPDVDEAAAPLEQTLELTIEEAFGGCVRDLRGQCVDPCTACGGLGHAAQPRSCADCGGAGRLRPHLWFAWMATPGACGTCAGTGKVQPACEPCAGTGRQAPRAWRARLRVPPGVRDGHLLRASAKLAGESASRPLDVVVRLRPHEFFTLEPDGTLRLELPVDGFAWVANRWIEVPTPSGPQQMRLQRGALAYRIRGKGFPAAPGSAHADCLVTVVPLFPETYSAAQEKLLDRLVASNSGHAATAAGARMQAWNERLGVWAARQEAGSRA